MYCIIERYPVFYGCRERRTTFPQSKLGGIEVEKLINELIALGWYPDTDGEGIYVNGYHVEYIRNSWYVCNSEGVEKWYKRFKPMLNFVTDY
jgi:hypothetical protein